MLYKTLEIKRVLESPRTPTLTRNLLSTALMADMQEAEFALEFVLDLIRQRNQDLFSRLRKSS